MGINWAEHTVEIAAPIGTCFDAIVDYDSFPRWQSAVNKVEVQSLGEDGLGERVRLYLSAKGQKVDYTLNYSYERPREIRWDFVEGNGVKDVDGTYRFEAMGDERTRASYKLGIDPSLPVPGIVARRIHSQTLKKSVEELKGEAERRHREPSRQAEPEPEPEREPPAAVRSGPEAPPPPARPGVTPPAPPTEERGETADPEAGLGAASPPQTAAEQAASLGREVAGGTVRLGLNLAGAAFAVARGAAGAGVEIARGVAGAVVDRASEVRGRHGPR